VPCPACGAGKSSFGFHHRPNPVGSYRSISTSEPKGKVENSLPLRPCETTPSVGSGTWKAGLLPNISTSFMDDEPDYPF
jgi:hypothetical protein